MKTPAPYGIHWFRRDLRIAGNAALQHNWTVNKGRVVGVFCFDSIFLSRPDFSHNRFALFLKTLKALQEEMREMGSDLIVIDELPQNAFPKIVKALEERPNLVTFNRDYEPFARERDRNLIEIFEKLKIETKTFRDHLVIEPDELFKTKPGEFYQVYSPFAKKWFDLAEQKEMLARISSQAAGLKYLESPPNKPLFSLMWKDLSKIPYEDSLGKFEEQNNKNVTIEIPEAGSKVAFKELKDFAKRLKEYKADRDIPSIDGTSKMSLFLKNGSITTAQIICYLKLTNKSFKTEDSTTRYLKELVWREFYYHILYHRPDVEKQAFLAKFRDIQWKNDKTLFKHWCDGTTGFPIVDAGMRQLNTTGWMHNRVRMIVASFLCKDLLIDWCWGENYFMKMLLDGDMAPNNGGWQWAASTGCDPQPYFRIFNPWLQSERFDPEAEYIKTYIPELKDIEASEIHDPEGNRGGKYPKPIVDHSVQKKHALALYKATE